MELYYERLHTLREAHLTACIKLRCGDESYRDYCNWTARLYQELSSKGTDAIAEKSSESTKKPATGVTVTSLVSAV